MSPESREKLLGSLIDSTERAVKAAKIEQNEVLFECLEERETLLARIWGFEDVKALPTFKLEVIEARKKFLPELPAASIAVLRDIERELTRLLENQMGQIKGKLNSLGRGERVVRNIQNLYGSTQQNRFNIIG